MITRDDWQQVLTLFDQVIELPESDRERWLSQACANEEIRLEVLGMLAGHLTSEGILDGELKVQAADLIAAALEKPPRSHVGPYRLIREIGAGGMGRVYLGERADGQFQQSVAVKLLRPGVTSEQVGRRFLAERQILAGFKHPNIAQLYDGGVLDDGTPYFVMEYVDGTPITEYCKDHRMTVEARLSIFLQVCTAVSRAHQKLVVHRDLKPSNILVTRTGQVKLLDFGIAKLLETGDDDPAGKTQTGLHLLTPEYASPEQVTGEPIATSSDVYQLGLILYEMLTERRAYELSSRALSVITHVVLQHEPPRPSGLFKGPEATISAPVSPRRWMHRLQGDLDAIVQKAIRKQATERYASVDQFSTDIQRHLEGRPIAARERSVAYRATKFVQRHRWQVGAVALIAAYAVTVTVQQASTVRQRDRAEAYANFLTELFASPDPFGNRADFDQSEMSVQAFLERASRRLDQDPMVGTAFKADLHSTIGQAFDGLGARQSAAVQYKKALELNVAVYGTGSAEAVESMRLLAAKMDDRGEADSLFRVQLDLARSIDGGGGPTTGRSLATYGRFLSGQGRLSEADSVFSRAIEIASRYRSEDPGLVAQTLSYAGDYYTIVGRLNLADSLLTEAIKIRTDGLGPDHPVTAGAKASLAYVAKQKGEYDRAETLQRDALKVFEARLGEDHPVTIVTLNDLALILSNKGDHAGAEAAMREVLAKRIEFFGLDDTDTIGSMQNLAAFLLRQGRLDEAEPMFHQIYELYRANLPPGHYYTAFPLLSLTDLYLQKGEFEKAATTGRESVDRLRAALPAGHLYTAIAESRLGEALAKLGRFVEAEPLLVGSYQALLVSEGAGDYLDRARQRLIACYEQWGKPEAAEEFRSDGRG